MVCEGLPQVFERHEQVAAFVRNSLVEIGYRLFPKPEAIPSPSVTAVYLPDGRTYSAFDDQVRAYGMGIGGSYGPLAGKIFRLGHMGTQATMENAQQALEVLSQILR